MRRSACARKAGTIVARLFRSKTQPIRSRPAARSSGMPSTLWGRKSTTQPPTTYKIAVPKRCSEPSVPCLHLQVTEHEHAKRVSAPAFVVDRLPVNDSHWRITGAVFEQGRLLGFRLRYCSGAHVGQFALL